MPADIKNALVIIKNAKKIWKFCVLQIAFFSLKFVGTVLMSFDLASAPRL